MPQTDERKIVAQIIARCWTDSTYRAAVKANPTEEFRKAGIELQPGDVVHVHETDWNNRQVVLPPAPIPPRFIPDSDLVARY